MATDSEKVIAQLMERWDEIRITDKYLFSPHDAVGVVLGKPMFPAIAIPVEKKRTFECPPQMLEELAVLLPHITKILVIGWRATEEHFLGMLGNRLTGLKAGVQLYIVAGPKPLNSELPGEDVKVRICRALMNNLPSSPVIDPGGFTDFILSRRVEQFLGN
jgi:hypothetical protein